MSETLSINPGGERQRPGRTKQLEGLRECNADLTDGDVVQDMGKCNAAYCGDDKDQVNVLSHMKRSANFSERASEREQER